MSAPTIKDLRAAAKRNDHNGLKALLRRGNPDSETGQLASEVLQRCVDILARRHPGTHDEVIDAALTLRELIRAGSPLRGANDRKNVRDLSAWLDDDDFEDLFRAALFAGEIL